MLDCLLAQATMIFVAGSANLDFVVRATHIPAPGETVLGRAFQTFPGGKGANQAVAALAYGTASIAPVAVETAPIRPRAAPASGPMNSTATKCMTAAIPNVATWPETCAIMIGPPS